MVDDRELRNAAARLALELVREREKTEKNLDTENFVKDAEIIYAFLSNSDSK